MEFDELFLNSKEIPYRAAGLQEFFFICEGRKTETNRSLLQRSRAPVCKRCAVKTAAAGDPLFAKRSAEALAVRSADLKRQDPALFRVRIGKHIINIINISNLIHIKILQFI